MKDYDFGSANQKEFITLINQLSTGSNMTSIVVTKITDELWNKF